MQAQIEVDGVWESCELFSPHNQPPAKDILPGGTEVFQPVNTQYNAKLVFPFHGFQLFPGIYRIRIGDKISTFSAEKPDVSMIWDNVS